MAEQRRVNFAYWADTQGADIAKAVVWPIGDDSATSPALANRLTIAIYTGATTTHLRITDAEARTLIDALQWALRAPSASSEQPKADADQRRADDLGQHAARVVDPQAARDPESEPDPLLQRVVDPLPQREQKAAQGHENDRLVRHLQRDGQRQHKHAHADQGEQLVPVVHGEILQPIQHGAALMFKSADDPSLHAAIRGAIAGTGPIVALPHGCRIETEGAAA